MSTTTPDLSDPTTSHTLVDPVEAAGTIAAEVVCTNCQGIEPFVPEGWCPSCGYHPKYDMCFDVETGDWEGKPADWQQVVPPWMIVAGVGALGIVVMGFVVRLNLAVHERAMWTLGQVLFGMISFCVGHVCAYTYAAAESDKFGPFDIFFKPSGLWKPTITKLPENAWKVWLASWGVTSIVVALAIVGGIDWNSIWEADWGVKKAAQGNLVSAVADQARREANGGESLEDSLRELDKEEKKLAQKMMKRKADCLVFGYVAGARDGEIAELLLASVYKKKLKHVGRIPMSHLPPEVQHELTRVIPLLKRGTPFVECSVVGAHWLHPSKLIRFEIDNWTRSGKILNPVFDEMLEDVSF